jgi:hypothetical protein
MSFIKGASLPEWVRSSKTLSKEAESEFRGILLGFNH